MEETKEFIYTIYLYLPSLFLSTHMACALCRPSRALSVIAKENAN